MSASIHGVVEKKGAWSPVQWRIDSARARSPPGRHFWRKPELSRKIIGRHYADGCRLRPIARSSGQLSQAPSLIFEPFNAHSKTSAPVRIAQPDFCRPDALPIVWEGGPKGLCLGYRWQEVFGPHRCVWVAAAGHAIRPSSKQASNKWLVCLRHGRPSIPTRSQGQLGQGAEPHHLRALER